jgi:hypothetical protein
MRLASWLALSVATWAILHPAISPSASGQVLINEFVAGNTTGLKDQDGERSDWVELHNPTAAPVNLGGWSLTDDPLDPVKWRFPATNLVAGGYLVVFASGKNRATAGAELHASFRLESNGGHIALVRPDATVASAFSYPPQKNNTAYGYSVSITTNPLVPEPATVRFRPSDDTLGFSWTGGAEPFSDVSWLMGVTGLGYDTNGTSAGPLLETVGEPAILRPVTDTASGSIFVLATAGFSQAGDVTEWLVYSTTTFPITPILMRLQSNGTYVITGLGTTRASSGAGLQTYPLGLVSGSARVGPGYYFGWKDGSNGGNNTGVPAWTDGGSAGVRWFQQHTTFSVNENLGAGQLFSRAYSLQARVRGTLLNLARTNVQSLMFGVSPSLQLRAAFNVASGQTFDALTLRMTYDDGFVAWLNGVEVARRNAPDPLTFNSVALTNRSLAAAVEPEVLDLSAFAGLVRSGANVLAVQALNERVDSPEFLILPELTGTKTTVATNRFLPVPTPGQPNGPGEAGFVADTKFTPNRGIYWAALEVAITNATPGSSIRFTTDGSWPSETNGTIYTAPIRITNTTVLRAAAFRSGFLPTDVDTHTYLFPANVTAQPANPPGLPAIWSGATADYEVDPNVTGSTQPGYHLTNALLSLPAISLTAEHGDLFDATRGIYYYSANAGPAWRRLASVEMIFPDGRAGFQANASVRMAGDSSANHTFTPKHSMRLAFRSALGQGTLKFPLFPDSSVESFDQIELRACSTDSWPVQDGYLDNGVIRWTYTRATYLRDQYMRDTLRDLGQPASHGRYVHLYLNGLYWGLYNIVEWMNDGWNEEHFGGDKSEYDVLKDYAEVEEGNATAWNEMLALVNAGFPTEAEYQRLQGNFPDGTRNPSAPVYVHVGNLIDYMLAHIYGGAEDWPMHNFWTSRRRGPLSEGFRFYAWDQEISNDSLVRTQVISGFGGTRFEAVNSPNCAAIIYDRLRRNPSFQQRFIDRVQEVMTGDGPLTPLACSNRWMNRQFEIDRAIVGESARWGDVRREPPFKRDTNWLGEMAWQAGYWASNHVRAGQRFRSVGLYPQLGAPLFSQLGGAVPAGFTLALANTNGSGSIYFTTDGSDPRLVNGNVAPQGQTYLEPYPVSGPVLVRARIRSGTNWSGIVTARFYPPQDLTPLHLTELMYHPTALGLVDGDEFEFLELKNTGAVTFDLSGLTFSSGINFTFTNGTSLAPGAFFVLARNPVWFASRYPGVPVHGTYTGRLDNSGERLALAYPGGGGTILSVTYHDVAPWPVTPDGHGFSLVPVNSANPGGPGLDLERADAWRASTLPGGSPGADDPAPTVAPVRISEARTYPALPERAAIELFNPTAAPVDLAGWLVTDDATQPLRFRIANGTTLAPGGYVVLDETQLNPVAGTLRTFSLEARGGAVYLYSGDSATNLTGYSHGFAFGAAARGENFGRHVISTGEEQFPAQRAPTLGAANSGPRIGPVVITEIHYHPNAAGALAEGDEFVELQNISLTNVALFDATQPSNTWRLNGADFAFPPGLELGPGQFALLVRTNPAAFAARHAVPGSVVIVGPFAGNLQNSGERLELQRPEPAEGTGPDTNGIPFITVDEVRYNDRAPWPLAADGSGPSLQKRNATDYGNDPANWEAAVPTPGRSRPAGTPPSISTPPGNQTVVANYPASFRVVATGSGPLRYQWHFNGDALPGATNAVLELTGVQPAQAGAYTVIVFNDAGSIESVSATLSVLRPATIVGHPLSVTLRGSTNAADYGSTTNRSAAFSVQAFSSTPLSFHWRYRGQPIDGALNPTALTPTLTINNVTLADDGAYDVLVRDSVGEVMSQPARLTVLLTPQFVVTPVNLEVVAGGNFTASGSIRGNPPPFTYQWRQGSTPLLFDTTADTNAFLLRTNVQLAQSGVYRLIISNAASPLPPNLTFTVTVLSDADADGLPDAWETAYFGSATAADRAVDSDGDGVSNYNEYLAGTDATNRLSYLKVESIAAGTGTGVTVTFGAISNRTYTLEFTDAAGQGDWNKLADLPARSTNWLATFVDSGAGTNRFYRLRTPRR